MHQPQMVTEPLAPGTRHFLVPPKRNTTCKSAKKVRASVFQVHRQPPLFRFGRSKTSTRYSDLSKPLLYFVSVSSSVRRRLPPPWSDSFEAQALMFADRFPGPKSQPDLRRRCHRREGRERPSIGFRRRHRRWRPCQEHTRTERHGQDITVRVSGSCSPSERELTAGS